MTQKSNVVSLDPARQAKGGPLELTARRIAALKPRLKVWDQRDTKVTGLMVRVYPSGSKVYYLYRRIGKGRAGRAKLIKLGDVSDLPLAEARGRALILAAEMLAGNDPQAAKSGALPLRDLICVYGDRLKARQVVKRKDVITCLQMHLAPRLRQPVGDLTRQQVVERLHTLEDAGKPGAAEYLRKCVTGMLNWAVDAGHLQASVMAGYRRERETRAERQRKDRLTLTTADLLRAFWKATEAAGSETFRDLLRFLLLTGQRRSETAAMRWGDLDGDSWAIPAEITKTGKPHRVPLGQLSRQVIDAQERYAGSDLVFPGRGLKQISGWTQQLQPVRDAMGQPNFAPHALRRSYRTGLAELGVSEALAEVMIAHKRKDLVARYNHSEEWLARRDAQARWEAHIAEVTA